MRVVCKNFSDEPERKKNRNWLTEGKEYIVLEILIDYRNTPLFRILSDNKTPALFDSRIFEITSFKIPLNWIIYLDNKIVELSPKNWQEEGFWDNYFNGDQNAKKIFEEEKKAIENSEN